MLGTTALIPLESDGSPPGSAYGDAAPVAGFDAWFARAFREDFPRVFRYLDRSCGDPELSSDIAQEAFLRLYRRGSAPDNPNAWLLTVAMNLLRNARSKSSRRRRLITPDRARRAHSEPPVAPDRAIVTSNVALVRAALDRMPERDRSLLLLRSQGFSYREMADTLGLPASSVGTMLARAKVEFRRILQEVTDAP